MTLIEQAVGGKRTFPIKVIWRRLCQHSPGTGNAPPPGRYANSDGTESVESSYIKIVM
jgi:hypothetical protein